MKIEVWSDYVCPFCYIGKRRLEEALASTGLDEKVEVIFKAYELDPTSPKTSNKLMVDVLAEKYNMSVEEAKGMTENVVEQAKTVQLNYDFANLRPANTFDAHRLAKFAEQENLGAEAAEKLLEAYFVEAKEIGKHEELLKVAEEIGLSKEGTQEVLASDVFSDEVKKDIEEARQIGVQGVPFFVIDRKYAISGAQPAETFANALQKAFAEQ